MCPRAFEVPKRVKEVDCKMVLSTFTKIGGNYVYSCGRPPIKSHIRKVSLSDNDCIDRQGHAGTAE